MPERKKPNLDGVVDLEQIPEVVPLEEYIATARWAVDTVPLDLHKTKVLWTKDEVRLFEDLLLAFGKDFYRFWPYLSRKQCGDIVYFYYRWKTTPRGMSFRTANRRAIRMSVGPVHDAQVLNKGVFTIDRILARKHENGRWLYKVRWEGYGPSEDTWEPKEHIQHTDEFAQFMQELGLAAKLRSN